MASHYPPPHSYDLLCDLHVNHAPPPVARLLLSAQANQAVQNCAFERQGNQALLNFAFMRSTRSPLFSVWSEWKVE